MANRGHFPPQKHQIYRPVGFEQPRIFNSPHYENAPIVPKAQNCAASPISQVLPSEPRRTYPTQVFQNNSDRGQAHLPKPDEQQEMRHMQIQPNYAVQVNYDHDKSRQPAKIPANSHSQNPHPQQVQISYAQRPRKGSDDMTMSKNLRENTVATQLVHTDQRVNISAPTRTVVVTKTISGSPFAAQIQKPSSVVNRMSVRPYGVQQQMGSRIFNVASVKNEGHSPTVTTYSAGRPASNISDGRFTIRFEYSQANSDRTNRLDQYKTLSYSELVIRSHTQVDSDDKVTYSRFSEGANIRSDYGDQMAELDSRAPLTVSMIVATEDQHQLFKTPEWKSAEQGGRTKTEEFLSRDSSEAGSQLLKSFVVDEKNQFEAESAFKKDKGSSLEPYKSTYESSKFSPQNAVVRKQNQLAKVRFVPMSNEQKQQTLKSSTNLNISHHKPQSINPSPQPTILQPQKVQTTQKITAKVQKSVKTVTSPRNSIRKAPKLDDFQIGRKLGKGKYGDVYMVEHKLTGFICAMKTIQKKLMKEENVQHQFIRQIKLQSFLRHENIVQLYGYFDDQENVYLLLELCEEGHLTGVLRRRKRLPEAETARIVSEICNGVDYMHRFRIIHRDLKPQNIIMQNGNVKICDFGWAVDISDGLRSTFCGTPLYVSPDVLRGDMYDEKIDLWAIGVLTYELLVGKVPFKIVCESDLQKILYDDITFPDYLHISDVAKDFIVNLMHKDPTQRMDMDEIKNHPFLRMNMKTNECLQRIIP